MAQLEQGMTHGAAIEHLRSEVAEVARNETGRLVSAGAPAFFAAVRAVMCDLDYVAALYYGWNGANRRQIATPRKTVRFIRNVMSAATSDASYDRWGSHLYELYRHGLVHLRAPKLLRGTDNSTDQLTWALMFERRGRLDPPHEMAVEHLKLARATGALAFLPVSIQVLFQDFLAAVDWFAEELHAEREADGVARLMRWRETANALVEPEDSALRW